MNSTSFHGLEDAYATTTPGPTTKINTAFPNNIKVDAGNDARSQVEQYSNDVAENHCQDCPQEEVQGQGEDCPKSLCIDSPQTVTQKEDAADDHDPSKERAAVQTVLTTQALNDVDKSEKQH